MDLGAQQQDSSKVLTAQPLFIYDVLIRAAAGFLAQPARGPRTQPPSWLNPQQGGKISFAPGGLRVFQLCGCTYTKTVVVLVVVLIATSSQRSARNAESEGGGGGGKCSTRTLWCVKGSSLAEEEEEGGLLKSTTLLQISIL